MIQPTLSESPDTSTEEWLKFQASFARFQKLHKQKMISPDDLNSFRWCWGDLKQKLSDPIQIGHVDKMLKHLEEYVALLKGDYFTDWSLETHFAMMEYSFRDLYAALDPQGYVKHGLAESVAQTAAQTAQCVPTAAAAV